MKCGHVESMDHFWWPLRPHSNCFLKRQMDEQSEGKDSFFQRKKGGQAHAKRGFVKRKRVVSYGEENDRRLFFHKLGRLILLLLALLLLLLELRHSRKWALDWFWMRKMRGRQDGWRLYRFTMWGEFDGSRCFQFHFSPHSYSKIEYLKIL